MGGGESDGPLNLAKRRFESGLYTKAILIWVQSDHRYARVQRVVGRNALVVWFQGRMRRWWVKKVQLDALWTLGSVNTESSADCRWACL